MIVVVIKVFPGQGLGHLWDDCLGHADNDNGYEKDDDDDDDDNVGDDDNGDESEGWL